VAARSRSRSLIDILVGMAFILTMPTGPRLLGKNRGANSIDEIPAIGCVLVARFA
jgi:hypothetical protein